MKTNFEETPQFKKDWKRLFKKYKTLPGDFKNFKDRMSEVDILANKKFAILYQDEKVMIIKARFFCQALRKNTLRIIYAQFKANLSVTFVQIDFLELYFKGDKEREDKERIDDYLNNI